MPSPTHVYTRALGMNFIVTLGMATDVGLTSQNNFLLVNFHECLLTWAGLPTPCQSCAEAMEHPVLVNNNR